jgi:hypothetical protein
MVSASLLLWWLDTAEQEYIWADSQVCAFAVLSRTGLEPMGEPIINGIECAL